LNAIGTDKGGWAHHKNTDSNIFLQNSEMSISAPPAIRHVAVAIVASVAPVATASPVIGSVVPAISPFETKGYDKILNESIVYRSANGDPLFGTMGVSWRVHEDLRPVAERLHYNRDALIKYVMKDAHYEPVNDMPARPTKDTASQLIDIFLFFNDPTQEFFFIKRGTSCQWLVRKTTGYYYSCMIENKGMAHRVGYQVIRKATAEESANQLGRGMKTMMRGGMTVSA